MRKYTAGIKFYWWAGTWPCTVLFSTSVHAHLCAHIPKTTPIQPYRMDISAPKRSTSRPESPHNGRNASEEGSNVEDGDWMPNSRAKKRKISRKNAKKGTQKTPVECWEDDVERVDIITKDPGSGELRGWLAWKTTNKISSHPLHLLYSRCPQKVKTPILGWFRLTKSQILKYYESQL